MVNQPQKVSVFKFPVHLLANYTQWLWERIEQQKGSHVITLNAEMTMLAKKNDEFAQTLETADLVVPDGAGVIFYLSLFGYKQQRCPGIELAESIIKKIGTSQAPYSIYFYGGGKTVAQKAAQKWQEEFPSLSIKVYDGYISSEEEEELLKDLKENQPKIIFVGLGVPRQEFWIKKYCNLCPNSLWMGIGGSFDIWAGVKIRAPKWLRNNNLEWLYRLYKEPYRWYRMLALPKFFFASITHRLFHH